MFTENVAGLKVICDAFGSEDVPGIRKGTCTSTGKLKIWPIKDTKAAGLRQYADTPHAPHVIGSL
jgi:hypothetical protein